MSVLDSTHKRKSAVITIIILLLLLFGIFNFGMKYMDPPIEYGVAINFGASDVGAGDSVENTKKQDVEETIVEETIEEVTEETVNEEVSSETIAEDVITDDTVEEAPVIEKKEETKKKVKKEAKPKKEEPKKDKPKLEKPKPSKATTDALSALLNGNSNDGVDKGEGDNDTPGVKGSKDGDSNSNKYYGNSSGGSGGNYNLAGRKALSKPIQKPNCEEEGTVVVSIEVDKNGKVIKAVPGVKGSTNTAPCLLAPAKQAALQTKWNADGEAPTKQKGTIIYKFSLSK